MASSNNRYTLTEEDCLCLLSDYCQKQHIQITQCGSGWSVEKNNRQTGTVTCCLMEPSLQNLFRLLTPPEKIIRKVFDAVFPYLSITETNTQLEQLGIFLQTGNDLSENEQKALDKNKRYLPDIMFFYLGNCQQLPETDITEFLLSSTKQTQLPVNDMLYCRLSSDEPCLASRILLCPSHDHISPMTKFLEYTPVLTEQGFQKYLAGSTGDIWELKHMNAPVVFLVERTMETLPVILLALKRNRHYFVLREISPGIRHTDVNCTWEFNTQSILCSKPVAEEYMHVYNMIYTLSNPWRYPAKNKMFFFRTNLKQICFMCETTYKQDVCRIYTAETSDAMLHLADIPEHRLTETKKFAFITAENTLVFGLYDMKEQSFSEYYDCSCPQTVFLIQKLLPDFYYCQATVTL